MKLNRNGGIEMSGKSFVTEWLATVQNLNICNIKYKWITCALLSAISDPDECPESSPLPSRTSESIHGCSIIHVASWLIVWADMSPVLPIHR